MSVKEDQIPDIVVVDNSDEVRKKFESEFNALSLKEALQKLVEYAKLLEESPEKEEDDLRDK